MGGLVVGIAATTASANNVRIDITADPPASPVGYHVGEIVRIAVRLRDETTDVNSLELAQADLNLLNATLVPQFDPNDSTNPITEPVIFGGGAPGDGQTQGANADAYPGPPLPGCPSNCLVGSVPSAHLGGTIYFWLRTSTSTAHLLDPPATAPGRLFLQFKIQFSIPGPVFVDALGPALPDGSSSGAFAQQSGTGTIWSNGDADTNNNISGGILILTILPEPASLGLLAFGALPVCQRRARI